MKNLFDEWRVVKIHLLNCIFTNDNQLFQCHLLNNPSFSIDLNCGFYHIINSHLCLGLFLDFPFVYIKDVPFKKLAVILKKKERKEEVIHKGRGE